MKDNDVGGKLVSVVLATYNGEQFIAKQIQSIVDQSHQGIELIVQDDQSTDRTVEIVESFRDKISLRCEVNRQRLGFVRNFEAGIRRARGDYIALCDQDDLWHKDKIATLLREIGDADLIHSDCELIDAHDRPLAPSWKKTRRVRSSAAELLFYNDVTGCTSLFKRRLLDSVLPFPEGLAYHDWWLAVCAATQNGLKYTPLPLVAYRQHGSQDTGAFESKGHMLLRAVKKLRIFNGAVKKTMSVKQLRNLNAGKDYLARLLSEQVLDDAIKYHHSLSEGFMHWDAFRVGLRRCGMVRPGDDLAYVKLVTHDLLG